MISQRENTLRAVRFNHPDYIPVNIGLNNACWHHYPQQALVDLMASHSLLFPNVQPPSLPYTPQYAPWRIAGQTYTDSWGCVWKTVDDGITGAVTKPALPDWTTFTDYVPPSPAEHNGWGIIDWDAEAQRIKRARDQGKLTKGNLRHGHTFLTLNYIRGYEALILDMADCTPELDRLIDMVSDFNLGLVQRYMALGVEWMGYPEDLGMQVGPMLSPRHFRRYIRPVYQRVMQPARDAGSVIHMHSDGDIRVLAKDMLLAGVEVINVQDLVNNLEWLRDNLKSKVCIDLDIDRQSVTRFGTPEDIDALIKREVDMLGDSAGGLMLRYDLMPGIPIENIKALFDAIQHYALGA